jgi:hypothetical protein
MPWYDLNELCSEEPNVMIAIKKATADDEDGKNGKKYIIFNICNYVVLHG